MTSQTLAPDRSAPMSAFSTQPRTTEAVAVDQQRARLMDAMKSQYQIDQQVKFLHLQAEADSLLQQLQALKQQRETSEAARSHDPG